MEVPAGFAHVSHEISNSLSVRRAVVTYGIDVNSLLTPQQIADEVADIFVPVGAQFMSSAAQVERTVVRFGPIPDGPTAANEANSSGAQPANAEPPQVATLIQKRTALGGRKHRGRLYMPWISEDNVNGGGVIDSLVLADLQTTANTWLADLEAALLPMVVLHNDASVPTPVTSLTVSSRVATQRRRLRG